VCFRLARGFEVGIPRCAAGGGGGEPLDRLVRQPMEIGRFLRFAVALSAALRQLHERGLIHKDIKSANAVVDPKTGHVWLTGFGIASRLPRERQSPDPPEFITGTLAYMAPEQTGRASPASSRPAWTGQLTCKFHRTTSVLTT